MGLVFDFDVEERVGVLRSDTQSSNIIQEQLKLSKEKLAYFANPASTFAAKLLRDTRYFIREEGDPDAILLATKLSAVGYAVTVRTALGGGASCFRNLRHEFLTVRGRGDFEGTEFIVEPALRQHFAIPHPTPAYEELLAAAPDLFVGTSSRLVPIVQVLCMAMADNFERQGLTLPPWRRTQSMLTKWLPNRARDTCFARASAPAHGDCSRRGDAAGALPPASLSGIDSPTSPFARISDPWVGAPRAAKAVPFKAQPAAAPAHAHAQPAAPHGLPGGGAGAPPPNGADAGRAAPYAGSGHVSDNCAARPQQGGPGADLACALRGAGPGGGVGGAQGEVEGDGEEDAGPRLHRALSEYGAAGFVPFGGVVYGTSPKNAEVDVSSPPGSSFVPPPFRHTAGGGAPQHDAPPAAPPPRASGQAPGLLAAKLMQGGGGRDAAVAAAAAGQAAARAVTCQSPAHAGEPPIHVVRMGFQVQGAGREAHAGAGQCQAARQEAQGQAQMQQEQRMQASRQAHGVAQRERRQRPPGPEPHWLECAEPPAPHPVLSQHLASEQAPNSRQRQG